MVVWSRNSAVLIAALCVALVACGSSSKNSNSSTGGSGSSGNGGSGKGGPGTSGSTGSGGGGAAVGNISQENDSAAVGSDLKIVFSPMYSGYDGGSHTFKIPAIVSGIADVKWSASDLAFVDLEDDPVTGGVMITTRKAGDVKIIARTGDLSGSSDLHITEYQPSDCELGDMRYHNDVGIDAGMMSLPGIGNVPDNASCANCHGDGAMFLDVQHTPEQTGGYSDDDLVNIFSKGFKPNGSAFHTRIPPQIYQRFHTWQATDDEKRGLVCYLRSFEPTPQGPFDFGGLGNRMGMGGPMGGSGGAAAGGAGGAAAGGAGGAAAGGTGGAAAKGDAGM